MSSIRHHRLGERHASVLARMQSVYPVRMRQSEEVLRRRLRFLEKSGKSLSWYIENKGEPVGYLLAYPQKTLVDVPNKDLVVYIDDLQVVPGHTTELYRLLKLLGQDMEEKGLSGLHIEGITRRRAYKVFKDHQDIIRRLGFELVRTYEYWDEVAGEEMCWMRWGPLRGSIGYGYTTEALDRWEVSIDLMEEV